MPRLRRLRVLERRALLLARLRERLLVRPLLRRERLLAERRPLELRLERALLDRRERALLERLDRALLARRERLLLDLLVAIGIDSYRDLDRLGRAGTFAPLRRALLSPMAIACLRFFTGCFPERM